MSVSLPGVRMDAPVLQEDRLVYTVAALSRFSRWATGAANDSFVNRAVRRRTQRRAGPCERRPATSARVREVRGPVARAATTRFVARDERPLRWLAEALVVELVVVHCPRSEVSREARRGGQRTRAARDPASDGAREAGSSCGHDAIRGGASKATSGIRAGDHDDSSAMASMQAKWRSCESFGKSRGVNSRSCGANSQDRSLCSMKLRLQDILVGRNWRIL